MTSFIVGNNVYTVDVYDKKLHSFIDERLFRRSTNVCKPYTDAVWNINRMENFSVTLALFHKKKAIGIAAFNLKENKKKKTLRVIVIEAFCLHENYRRKGISDVFLQLAIVLAKKELKTTHVLLYGSIMGKKLYQRNGFQKLTGKAFIRFSDALYEGLEEAKTAVGVGYENAFYGAMKLNNKKFQKALHGSDSKIKSIFTNSQD